jgi:hypothetical protein
VGVLVNSRARDLVRGTAAVALVDGKELDGVFYALDAANRETLW